MSTSLRSTVGVLAVVWGVFLLQQLRWVAAERWGIVPRHLASLWGILAAPLLHANWTHLISNSAPLAILGWMVFQFYGRIAWVSWALIHLLTGLAVWLLARGNAVHIGASGVVYGLAGFLLGNGVFRRDFRSISLMLIVLSCYSGLIFGILPTRPGVSWESHLLGGVVGWLVAYELRGISTKPLDPTTPTGTPLGY